MGGGSRPGSEASPVLGAKRKDQGDPWRPLRCGPAVAGGGGDRGISSSSQSRVTESVEILGIANCHSYAQLAGGPWRPPVLDTKPSSGDSGWGRSPEGCGGPSSCSRGFLEQRPGGLGTQRDRPRIRTPRNDRCCSKKCHRPPKMSVQGPREPTHSPALERRASVLVSNPVGDIAK